MGRHGKNLRPLWERKQMDKMDPLTAYEKYMIDDAAKKDMVKKATDTCMAAASSILLYHMEDIASCPPDERLKVFYGLLNRYINEKLEHPDERQQFAEWYWSSCTGNPLIRVEHKKEYDMAKKYSNELSLALKKRINEQGYDMKDICPACNISKGVYYNLTGGGNYSKKAFDAVAEYIGLEMDDDLEEMYKVRFDIGDMRRTERMEAMALEIEKEPEIEEKVEAPAMINEEPVQLPGAEDLAEAVEAVANNEEEAATLPYSDVNEMYKEAKPVDEKIIEANMLVGSYLVSPECLMQNIENYGSRLPELEEELESLKKEAEKLDKFIRVIKAFKSI